MQLRQRGFSTIEVVLWSTIVLLVIAKGLAEVRQFQLRSNADSVGQYMARYNGAVSEYIDNVRATLPAGTTNYTGVSWLKASSCPGGSSAQDFLNCGFPASTLFGLSPSTVVVRTGEQITATTTYGTLQHGGAYHGVYSNMAVKAALVEQSGDVPVSQLFEINPTNNLQSIADTNTANEFWWRLDGTNTPTADLSVGNNSFTDVNCVGFDSADICRNGAGNLTFGGANVAGVNNLNTGSINNTGNISTDTMDARTATAAGSVIAPRFIDRDNSAYRMDPNGTTRLDSLSTGKIRITGRYSVGGACNTKEVSTDASGNLLNCVSGVWRGIGGSVTDRLYSGGPYTGRLQNLGEHKFCAMAYVVNAEDSHYCRVYKSGRNWYRRWYKTACHVRCV